MSLEIQFRTADGKLHKRKPKTAAAGSYYIIGTHRGQRARQSARTLEIEIAEKVRDAIKRRIDNEIDGVPGRHNLAYAIAQYIKATGNERYFGRILDDPIAKLPLKDVTGDALQNAAERLYPGTKAATRNRQVYTPIIAAYTHAAALHIAPDRRFRRPKGARSEKPDLEYMRDESYLPRLREVLSPVEEACVLFLVLTGERVSATAALTWDKVNLTLGRVELKTKTGPQSVALHRELVLALKRIHRPGATGRVFGYSTRWGIGQMLARRQGQAGLPRLSPHRLGRHTFISQLLNRGASTADVAKAARSSEQMIAKVYGHLEQSRTDRLILELPVAPSAPDTLATQLPRPSSEGTAPETEETEGNSGG